jgi:hypothetical protein
VKLVSVVALFSVLMLALASFASGAAPASLKTFGTGAVAVTGSKSATIVNGAGEYGGVYVQAKSLHGKLIGKTAFSFTSTGSIEGGAPRFSIPINWDGSFDENADYAFLDVANCGSDWVSTDNAACKVFFHSESFDNWADFASTYPAYKIADAIPFIIADQPGNYSVTGIDLH